MDQPMIDDAKRLLALMGVPYVQAPGEGEAQAAFMASRGDAWAASSRDYDSILFGSPRVVRYLTVAGKEFLPSKGTSRPLKPEMIELSTFLSHHGITREQLVDLAILIGTDFNEGIRGVGPKTALKLIRRHGSVENLRESVRDLVPDDLQALRNIFLQPKVTLDYSTSQQPMDEGALLRFLCDERGFAQERVKIAVERMKRMAKRSPKPDLEHWLGR